MAVRTDWLTLSMDDLSRTLDAALDAVTMPEQALSLRDDIRDTEREAMLRCHVQQGIALRRADVEWHVQCHGTDAFAAAVRRLERQRTGGAA